MTKLRRLAYLDPHPVPDVIPEAMQILQNVDALAEFVQVSMVTPVSSHAAEQVLGRGLDPRVEVVGLTDYRQRWWYPSGSNRLFYWQAARWLAKHQVDAVLVRNLKLADALSQALPDIPLFFETHELFAQSYWEEHQPLNAKQQRKWQTLREREQRVYRASRGLITLTPFLSADIEQAYFQQSPAPALHVAADGVDWPLAQQALAQRKTQPQTTPQAELIMLYLGSLHPWKGVDSLIQALPQVERGQLWIAGGGSERIQALQHVAQQLGVQSRVQFLGAIAPQRRFELIAQADICLLPLTDTSIGSRYTSPLKLFEYMAMGKAIVSAAVPAITEVLTHGHQAWLCRPGELQELSAALNRLCGDESLRQQLGQQAAILAQQYSWQARAQGMVQFMERSLAG
ncbi:glycosyltransferase family 4 protein [Balneatrix alpica]|uniref:Glycosyltransferase family 4 protein n=1 Tax=Balneatrix alpica TaxID=75684 RepID=A0ABV5ZB21_9GAMM|nr:glycosyltransferase family 4 protein [Balneatrix alpica]